MATPAIAIFSGAKGKNMAKSSKKAKRAQSKLAQASKWCSIHKGPRQTQGDCVKAWFRKH